MLFSLPVLLCKTKGDFTPVAMVLVVLGGVDHGASFDANLLEQVPHLLVDVLLRRQQGNIFDVSHTPPEKKTNGRGRNLRCL